LKDNDLKKKFRVGSIFKDIIPQLHKDGDFLRDLGIMDYSLLVGIHNCAENKDKDHFCPSPPSFPTTPTFPSTPPKSSPSVSFLLSGSASNNNDNKLSSSVTQKRSSGHSSEGEKKEEKKEENKEENKEEKPLDGIKIVVDPPPAIYYIGIIDCLQQWNWAKRLEQYTKIVLKCHCRDYHEMSAVEPRFYAERFNKMVDQLFVE